MFLFENSKEKKLRQLIQSRLEVCLTNSQKYEQSMEIINSYVRASEQKVIEMVVDKIKETIKDDDTQPFEKLQAITLLADLMRTYNKALGKYVVKKILKRLTIFAEHKKASKDEERGKDIFGKAKRTQEANAARFLNKLLSALEQWGKNWPKAPDGPSQDFHQAYKELLIKQVQFPKEIKRVPVKSVSPSPNNLTNKMNPQPPSKTEKRNSIQKISYLVNSFHSISLILYNPLIFSSKFFPTKKYKVYIFQILVIILLDVVNSIRQTIRQGDEFYSRLYQNPDQNQVLLDKITQTFELLKKLQNDTPIIQRNSNKMQTYKNKYIKNSKKIITSLEFYVKKSTSIKKQESMVSAPVVPPAEIKPEPLIRQQNRYQSNDKFHLSLQQLKKQQFNSNSHSSQRYGSFGGVNQKNKSRESKEQQNNEIPQRESQHKQSSIFPPKKVQKQPVTSKSNMISAESSSNVNEKSRYNAVIKRQTEHQAAIQKNPFQQINQIEIKGSKKQTSKQQNPFNSSAKIQEIKKQKPKQQNAYNSSAKNQSNKSDSNAKQEGSVDFFQKMNNDPTKNVGILKPGKRNRKDQKIAHNAKEQNIFQANVQSKIQFGLSAFQFTQNNTKSDNRSANEVTRSNLKTNNILGSKESDSKLPSKGEIDPSISAIGKKPLNKNPFDSNSNPFETLQKFPSFQGQPKKKQDSQAKQKHIEFAFDDPNFDKKSNKVENPFSENSISKKSQSNNPFDSQSMSQKQDQNQKHSQHSENPFENRRQTVQSVNFQQMLKRSFNPQKGNVNGRESENPFDVNSHSSKKSFDNPFQTQIKNPSFNPNLGQHLQPMRQSLNLAPQRISVNDGFNFEDFGQVVRNSQVSFNKSERGQNANATNQMKQSIRNSGNFNFQQPQKPIKVFDFDDFGKESSKGSKVSKNQKKEAFNFDDFGKNFEHQSKADNFWGQEKKSAESIRKSQHESSNSERKSENNIKESIKNIFQDFNPKQLPIQQKDSESQKQKFKKFDFDDFRQFDLQIGVKTQKSEQQSQFNYSQFDSKQGIEKKKQSLQERYKSQTENQLLKKGTKIQLPPSQPFISSNSVIKPMSNSQKSDFKKKQSIPIIYGTQQKPQHSISIQFEDLPPISKKGVQWNPTISIQKPPQFFNLSKQELTKKQGQLQHKKQTYLRELNLHHELRDKHNQIKQKLLKQLGKVQNKVDQKEEYQTILTKLRQNNELKEKHIDDMHQKIKKIQAIRLKMLQKEKLLFEYMKKNDYQQVGKVKPRNNPCKWEIFNKNLQNFRNSSNMGISTRSYIL